MVDLLRRWLIADHASLLRRRLSTGFAILGLGVTLVWALQQEVRSPGFLRAQTAGDVETWNAIDDMKVGASYPNYLWAIAYGAGKFVAMGDDGKGAYSADGITWTAIPNTGFPAGYSIRSITYGAGKFVALGESGKGAYSADGITWIPISNMQFNSYWGDRINAVAYANGKFVAVGDNSVAYSVDGITWTAGTVDAYGGGLYHLAYGDGKFFTGKSYRT